MHLGDPNCRKQLAALKKIKQHVDTLKINVNTINSIPYEIAKYFNSNKAPDSEGNEHYENFPTEILDVLNAYLQSQFSLYSQSIEKCSKWCKEPKEQFYAGINQCLKENRSAKDCIEIIRNQFIALLYECMPTRPSNNSDEIFPSCFRFVETFFKKIRQDKQFYDSLKVENNKKHANNFYVDALLLAYFDVITPNHPDKFIFVTNEKAIKNTNPQNFEIMTLCEYKTRVGFLVASNKNRL